MRKLILIFLAVILITGCGKKEEKTENKKEKIEENISLSIIDENSNSRPYAVIINNFPDAVKVQTGLSDAYMIYEFPVEGGMTRSMALYKDKTTSKIGTVRSARHNFLDYVMENDAIFVHFGWSFYAQQQIPQLGINNINGLSDSPFWRENPEGLASEHTAYTSLEQCITVAQNKGYRLTTDVKPSLNYTTKEVKLNAYNDSVVANTIDLPYSYVYGVEYIYNSKDKVYDRYVNGVSHTDYFTGESYTAKNILVLKIDFEYTASNYYLELKNIGSGKGYYITNGYAKEITWEKNDRSSQTIYKYLDGTKVEINDGNTHIMFHSNSQNLNVG